jgi:hypothetical protein
MTYELIQFEGWSRRQGATGSTRSSTDATATLRPKYGRMYGFEEATLPNAEMVAWAMFEYR